MAVRGWRLSRGTVPVVRRGYATVRIGDRSSITGIAWP
jgi:hypothetical protein